MARSAALEGLVLLDIFDRRLLGAMTAADPKEVEGCGQIWAMPSSGIRPGRYG